MAKRGKTVVDGAKGVIAKVPAPSPNPMTNLIITDIALRAGGTLLRHTLERGAVGAKIGAKKAGQVVKGRSMMQTLVGTAVARIATRSVPGAIVVGGGLLIKTLADRKRARQSQVEGTVALDEQLERGKKS